jgi:hypothetical protein
VIAQAQRNARKFGPVLLICVLCLGLTGCLGTYFGTTMPQNLVDHGITARARILDIWDTGWTVNDNPAIGMHVQVQPTDRPAFQATVPRVVISRIALAQYQPGQVIQVRFDPANPAEVAVDDGSSDSGSDGVSPTDLARIHGPGLVPLAGYYEVPALPAPLQGLRVAMIDEVVGQQQPGESAAQIAGGCRQSAASLFGQLGWVLVRDTTQPHDLVVRGDCSASASFITIDDTLYVLFPEPATGMRFETASGQPLLQLQPTARTFQCPSDDETQCGSAVQEYVVAQVVGQLARSAPLAHYAASLGAGRR